MIENHPLKLGREVDLHGVVNRELVESAFGEGGGPVLDGAGNSLPATGGRNFLQHLEVELDPRARAVLGDDAPVGGPRLHAHLRNRLAVPVLPVSLVKGVELLDGGILFSHLPDLAPDGNFDGLDSADEFCELRAPFVVVPLLFLDRRPVEHHQRGGIDVDVVEPGLDRLLREILDLPRMGSINVHPSLLPKYRGPTPIQNAILNGDEEVGVSLMLLDEEVDHGPILAQRELDSCQLSVISYKQLSRELAKLGAKMLIDVLPKYVESEITPKEQEHDKATFTKKFTVEDSYVPFEDLVGALGGNDKALHIDRMIRAFNPEPGAWTKTEDEPVLDLPKNKRIKLLESEVRDGKLILKQVQTEGKKPRSL